MKATQEFYGTWFNMEFVKSCKKFKDFEQSQPFFHAEHPEREARLKEVYDSVHGKPKVLAQ